MAIAKGKSCFMDELDILKDTLENMINSTEFKFRDIIDSLKAKLFDIEHDSTISTEERNTLSCPCFIELERYVYQRNISRNKLVICIYSMCEATLASICKDYNYVILKEPVHSIKPIYCPNLNGRECNVKRSKKSNFYINDYLYTLNCNYAVDWVDAYIVSTAIKNLRNYLTHSKPDVIRATKIIEELSSCQFNHIKQVDGKIRIMNVEAINKILNLCYTMLINAEQIAKSNQ